MRLDTKKLYYLKVPEQESAFSAKRILPVARRTLKGNYERLNELLHISVSDLDQVYALPVTTTPPVEYADKAFRIPPRIDKKALHLSARLALYIFINEDALKLVTLHHDLDSKAESLLKEAVVTLNKQCSEIRKDARQVELEELIVPE